MTPSIRLFALSGLLAFSVAGQVQAEALLSNADYETGKNRAEATYDTDKAGCDGLSGNKKDVCVEQAKARRTIAKADLEARHKGTAKAYANAGKEKADANYSVAKEMCDDYAGDAKSLCLTKAKAEHESALADVKANKKTYDAMKEARDDKRAAAYDVAAKKCDSLAGDAKDSCIESAKQQYRQ